MITSNSYVHNCLQSSPNNVNALSIITHTPLEQSFTFSDPCYSMKMVIEKILRVVQFSKKNQVENLGPIFSDPKHTRPKVFQTELTRS